MPIYIKYPALGSTASVDSVNGQTGVVVLTAADVGAATTAQGALADTALQQASNLSDLVSAPTARTNLGLGTAALDDSTDFVSSTPTVNAQVGTTYTLQASDSNNIVTLSNASPITVTLPDTLPVGFNCIIMQLGAGTVSLTPSGAATLNNRQGHTDLGGQFAAGSVIVYATQTYMLAGDTA